MAKIPVIQQLQRQDFPEAPAWITKLLYPLQLFMTTVIGALTNNLTYQDNFSCVVNTLVFTAAASQDLNKFSFLWPYTRQPIELTMHVTRTDGSTPTIYAVPSWILVGGSIQVQGIQGLTNGAQYNIVTVVR
ncbi:MAG TPA: hypothetical protein VNX68_09745 [Nitrosopumilaceae archaeon]|jgi:hypothetical protein|nr:hypothetical protein [Nitrosopumilaceae archaeon]